MAFPRNSFRPGVEVLEDRVTPSNAIFPHGVIAVPNGGAPAFARSLNADDLQPDFARALKLSGDGQFQINFATLEATLAASGHSTFLGHWTSTGNVQLVPTGPTTIDFFGSVTLTAANGDKLCASVAGTIDRSTDTAVATWTFGGDSTGRFANASGTAQEFAVIHDFDAGIYSLTLDGDLSFSARDRRL